MTTTPEIGMSITSAGIVTNVHDTGFDPGGGTVLLIHGSGPGVSAWANWRLTMPVLAEHFRVLAPDLAGFGYSDRPPGDYSMDEWTAHALGVLDHFGIESAHVVGNSFGGSIALSLAIHHPFRVRRLVLMGSVGVPSRISPGLDAVWGYMPSVDNMRALLDLFTYDKSYATDDLAKLRYEASIRPGVQENFAAMFPPPRQRSLDAMSHSFADLAAIDKRTLIVHGRDDQVIPLATSYTLLDLIPRSELHVFGQCGHWTQIEHTLRFNDLVLGFLRDSAS